MSISGRTFPPENHIKLPNLPGAALRPPRRRGGSVCRGPPGSRHYGLSVLWPGHDFGGERAGDWNVLYHLLQEEHASAIRREYGQLNESNRAQAFQNSHRIGKLDLVIDVPQSLASLADYSATVGHKVNCSNMSRISL